MKSESLWIVSANCGDYYCGCGLGHLVGIATSEEKAEQIRAEADAAVDKRIGDSYKLYYDPRIERFPVDEFVLALP